MAPDFTLRNPEGEEVSLRDFRGAKNVVLIFYPGAFSPVCTEQLTSVAANEGRYAGEEAQVIGISVDGRFAQGAFATFLGLRDVILLADFEPKGEVARRYGVYMDGPGFAGRATFIIDRGGIVRHVAGTETPADIPDEEEYFRTGLAACAV